MPIKRGAVYYVRPGLVRFLPKIKNPIKKERPVVVYTCDEITKSEGWTFLTVMPISTSEDWSTEHCAPVSAGESDTALKEDSWVRISHIQPISKGELHKGRYTGTLSPLVMQRIDEYLVIYAGMDLTP